MASQNAEKYHQHKQSMQPTQEELCEFLVAKLRNFDNVEITINPFENARGTCYGIDVKNKTLSNLGNGVFHSLSLRTVSHTSRVINIKLVFNDDNERNADMQRNADAIMQIYREICNTVKPNGEINKTLETVRIDEFEDARGNKHLTVIGESTRGASLIYTYLKTMEFVREINDKYAPTGTNAMHNQDTHDEDDIKISEDMTLDELDATKALLERKLKAIIELREIRMQVAATSKNETTATNDEPVATNDDTTSTDGFITPRTKKIPKKFTISVGNKIIQTIKH